MEIAIGVTALLILLLVMRSAIRASQPSVKKLGDPIPIPIETGESEIPPTRRI